MLRPSIINTNQKLKVVTNVEEMNKLQESVKDKMRGKYLNCGSASSQHDMSGKRKSVQPVYMKASPKFFNQVEDLRSKSNSKIGCGVSRVSSQRVSVTQSTTQASRSKQISSSKYS